MAAFIPGNLLLCEECRIACFRLMKRAKMEKKGHHEDKRMMETEAQEKREEKGAGKDHQAGRDRDFTGTPEDATARTGSP